ncbi:hypothetical protein [Bradyrhizobium sp. UFLA05-153]
MSMSRPGNPFDNPKAENFMKPSRTEEINGRAFDINYARRRINSFIAEVYNRASEHPSGYWLMRRGFAGRDAILRGILG